VIFPKEKLVFQVVNALLNNDTVMLKEGTFQMLLLAVQDIGKTLVFRGSYRKLTTTLQVTVLKERIESK
jgi:hypothetical protein